ncbi:protein SLOW GREEN 1, chloroplastic-like [Nymphaea colorata]|uniref:Uncharacterized protein n=1 Tax=Nymphaea colorata TaxID=210225 RepID=A0A5K1DY73_9MAGN|nr:protein SLOW GREEN 1, chloroplastic-like [Nymphaea colorata]XP_031488786.1 protein SLOW GREEN 1, chloroplastic-like [Nymphaea colorata]XP_031488787.1 protein SLOW GREEN 1, chloroplastic-like [Nymphaea colorata]
MASFPISLHLTTTTTRSRSSSLSFPFLNAPSPFLKIPGPVLFRKAPQTAPLVMAARGGGFPLRESWLTGPLRAFDSLLRRGGVFLTATAVFLGCLSAPFFGNQLSSAIAAPVTVEAPETQTEEEKERYLEEYLDAHPDDVDALKALMEVKIKMGKIPEAISVIDRLITLEPDEKEWPLMRGHVRSYEGDNEGAKQAFEEILAADPLSVEAYHGLVMAASQSQSTHELEGISKRIESAMVLCQKEQRREDARDFRLLMAQIRVVEGRYEEALKIYRELVKEDPKDFRPYLCQGIIYTLLRKKDDAEKQFEKYRRLVPRAHPYARFFDDNVLATKVFSQMAENQSVQR